MRIMSLKNNVLVFWGIMDGLALVSYFYFSLQSGNVPFYSDISSFYTHFSQLGASGLMGVIIQVMFFINIALIVSLFFSCWSLIVKKDIHSIFFIGQEIARLLSLKCSLALIPLFMHFTGYSAAWGAFLLFFVSEALKIGSVVWAKRHPVPHADSMITG
ncbi:hypothetical protein GA0061071_10212 [Kosakonia oryzendophytica]|uniref:Uncharacterized protein n=2 Tax=Kosakonia TaxID=1330547 RepID=A0A1C3ZMB0_9ENTR|nr:hypothetical protein [Kosakonia oryzendophytica]SCB83478.1 hypothetical protein GA0061071_10212 [Kosakonia oryzendophytica]